MIIYLAGGSKCIWQDRAIELLSKHEVIDPRSWSHISDPKTYTAQDLAGIRRADVVVAQMDSSNPSGFGLSVEFGFALGIGKKIVFVDEIRNDWRSKYFGMHRTIANSVCWNVEEIPMCVGVGE